MEKKVVWLSRHPMTGEQVEGLEKILGPIEIETVNHVWRATDDWAADNAANYTTLKGWFEEGYIVAGVFPPVAIEALNEIRSGFCGFGDEERKIYRLYTPVSVQTVDERSDGERKIAFRHARWAVI